MSLLVEIEDIRTLYICQLSIIEDSTKTCSNPLSLGLEHGWKIIFTSFCRYCLACLVYQIWAWIHFEDWRC